MLSEAKVRVMLDDLIKEKDRRYELLQSCERSGFMVKNARILYYRMAEQVELLNAVLEI